MGLFSSKSSSSTSNYHSTETKTNNANVQDVDGITLTGNEAATTLTITDGGLVSEALNFAGTFAGEALASQGQLIEQTLDKTTAALESIGTGGASRQTQAAADNTKWILAAAALVAVMMLR